MKVRNTPIFIIFFLVTLPGFLFSQLNLNVVYPKEEQIVTSFDSTFVFGSVNTSNAEVRINGFAATVYPNGSFLAFVPVRIGDFEFDCVAYTKTDTAFVVRKVSVAPYLKTFRPETIAIDSTSLSPQSDLELIAGDYINVSFRGTPGLHARFSVLGIVENVGMVEMQPMNEPYWGEAVFGSGSRIYFSTEERYYHGIYKVPNGTQVDTAKVIFTLDGTNGKNLKLQAPGKVTIVDEQIPTIGQLTEDLTVARTAPALGYRLFLPVGVKVHVTGKRAGYYRIKLNGQNDVWLPTQSIEFLPPGTPIPYSKVTVVRADDLKDKIRIKIFLQEKLPFNVEQENEHQALLISIYGADSNTDWIKYDFEQNGIDEMIWHQPQNQVYQLKILFNLKQQWGYDVFYDNSALVVDIKRPPKNYSLKNMLLVIDPGHGPQDGAIGSTGLTERYACLQLANVLELKLKKKGADVFMTRKGYHGASLTARTKMAAYLEADMFLSLHYNALPDGVNPFQNHGISTYYYHPQSRILAMSIQKQLLGKLKLPNYGIFYDNLAVCRMTQMPSVLIEPAFIMHPEEEKLLLDPEFQNAAADAIISGIEQFLKQAKDNGNN